MKKTIILAAILILCAICASAAAQSDLGAARIGARGGGVLFVSNYYNGDGFYLGVSADIPFSVRDKSGKFLSATVHSVNPVLTVTRYNLNYFRDPWMFDGMGNEIDIEDETMEVSYSDVALLYSYGMVFRRWTFRLDAGAHVAFGLSGRQKAWDFGNNSLKEIDAFQEDDSEYSGMPRVMGGFQWGIGFEHVCGLYLGIHPVLGGGGKLAFFSARYSVGYTLSF
jgi:opacity protein-like surface antigen